MLVLSVRKFIVFIYIWTYVGFPCNVYVSAVPAAPPEQRRLRVLPRLAVDRGRPARQAARVHLPRPDRQEERGRRAAPLLERKGGDKETDGNCQHP